MVLGLIAFVAFSLNGSSDDPTDETIIADSQTNKQAKNVDGKESPLPEDDLTPLEREKKNQNIGRFSRRATHGRQ